MKQVLKIVALLISSVAFGQDDNSIPEKWRKYLYDHIVTLTKIDFYVNDTVIPYTLVQEPDGSYSFVEGHQFTEDSVTFDYQITFHVAKEKKDTLIPNVVFEKKHEIVKLHDFVSHFSSKNGGILYTYDFDFQFLPYIHELNYSFIFWKIGLLPLFEIDNDSIIRLTSYKTSPLTSNAPQIVIYELTSAFTQIVKKEYLIDSSQNFKLKRSVIIPLIKREMELLNSVFHEAKNEELKFSAKTRQYNPFLLEFQYNGVIEIIERSDGADSDERDLNPHNYHSKFQNFVELVNSYGNMSDRKIQKRIRKMKK
jgi:hypothetical protein